MSFDRIKCFLGLHKYEKFMGPQGFGDGKFRQRYKCSVCGKVKVVVG